MRHKKWFFTLILTGFLLVPCIAGAVATKVHPYECKTCHTAGIFQAGLGNPLANNVCITCHNPADGNTPHFAGAYPAPLDGQVEGVFSVADASNKYNSGITGTGAAADQTSHNWGAAIYNPEAGASAPTDPSMQSRYGASSGFVTCTRCHDPHGNIYDPDQGRNNPKLFYTGSVDDKYTGYPGSLVDAGWQTEAAEYNKKRANAMCVDCHKAFANPADGHGFGSHFTGTYGMDADPDYKTIAEIQAAASELKLIDTDFDGNLEVACVSCHGTHNTDSDATSTDGVRGNMVAGADGNLLRGDGEQFINDATRSTSLCNTCHNFESMGVHGTGPNAIGCLACHGGHNYNDGNPSYYMLNGNYPTLPNGDEAIRAANWGGTQAGVADGFCETCHGNLEDNFNALTSVGQNHTGGFNDCTQCHLTHLDGGFSKPVGCTGCHGYAPSINARGDLNEGGFAFSTATTNRYNTSGVFKDESKTPHETHANGNGKYDYGCNVCHGNQAGDTSLANHDGGSFQEVLDNAVGTLPSITSSAGGLNPTYTATGAGTCNAVYCHSNGGANDGLGNRDFSPVAGNTDKIPAPQWQDTKTTIYNAVGDARCGACHGNDSGEMASPAHDAHLDAGFSCNNCHLDTAINATALTGTAIGGTHVDGDVDVKFDTNIKGNTVAHETANPYIDATAMTCDGVYCHSTGQDSVPADRVFKSVSWKADLGNITCTSCHDITSGTDQTVAHAAHINGSGTFVGRDLDCNICHDDTMNAGDYASNQVNDVTFHVNGQVDINMNTAIDTGDCSNISCHSDGNYGGTVTYKDQAWTAAPLALGCDDCHGDGAGKSHPTYTSGGAGTEDANSHVEHVESSSIACDECHTATSTAGTALDGTDATQHVDQTIDVVLKQGGSWDGTDTNKTCSTTYCHGGSTPQWGGNINCGDCHAANNTLADSHSAHYNSASVGSFAETNTSVAGDYQINCGVCHSTNQGTNHAGGEADANYTAEVNFDGTIAEGTGVYNNGAVFNNDPNGFNYSNATCASLYCHGNFGGNGNAATPEWGNAASGACGTCHDVDGATMDGGVHETHVNNVGLTCDYCHQGTAVNAAGGIVDHTLHVNQLLNWDLDESKNEISASSTYKGSNAGTTAKADVGVLPYGNCNNIYCHSDVQDSPPNGLTGVTFDNPNWNGAVNCGDCHDAGPAGGAIEQSSGSHLKHVSASSYNFSCSTCHQGAGSGTANHANYSIDVDINNSWGASASYGGTAVPGDAYAGCASVYCHSDGQSTLSYNNPTWGTTISTCTACHDDAAAGSTLSGAHTAHFNGATMQTIGKALGCADCHTSTVSDNTTIADYSLHVNGGVDVASCATNVCHSNGNFGADLVQYNPNFASDTLDCFDCHGDGVSKSHPTYANGGPADDSSNSHVAHVETSLIRCEECHADTSTTGTSIDGATPAQHVDGGIDVVFNQTGSYVDGTDTCSTTYCHGSGEPVWGGAALDCDACHSASSALADTHGVHYNSSTVATSISTVNNSTTLKYIFECGNCHNGTTHAGGAVSDGVQAAEVIFAGNGTYNAALVSAGTDRGFDYTAGNCTTNDCHNDGTAAQGAPNYNGAALQWSVTNLPGNCTGCHNNNVASGSAMATGSHTTHLTTTYGSSKTCNTCHNDTVDGTDRAISDKTVHVNQVVNVAILPAVDGGNSAYAGSCDAVYCHSTGQSTTDANDSTPTYATASWATPASGDCGTCHAVAEGSGLTSGSHAAHLGTAMGLSTVNGCGDCHTDAADDASSYNSAQHVDMDMDVANTYNAAGALGNGYGTCSAASCHDDGTGSPAVTPRWGTVVNDCSECHANDMTNASHSDHLTTTITTAITISCGNCHGDAVKATSAISDGIGTHIDGNVDVYNSASADLGYPAVNPLGADYQTCNTTYCHGDTLKFSTEDMNDAVANVDVSPTWGANLSGAGNGCDYCHGYPPVGDVGAGAQHPTSDDCSACHFHVEATADLSFSDASKHIDGIVQIDGGNNCTDCHGSGKYKDPNTLHPDHGSHTDVQTYLAGKTLPGGDYAGADWYDVYYNSSGRLIVGCGQCHPDTQPTHPSGGAVEVDLVDGTAPVKMLNSSPSWSSNQCSGVYCHSDGNVGGVIGFKVSPTWDIIPDNGGVTCASCHGNAPSTGAHSEHEVAIHIGDLYDDDGEGLMARDTSEVGTGTFGAGATHGDAGTSDPISCYSCHNDTVKVDTNASQTIGGVADTGCAECHKSGGSASAKLEEASIAANSTAHLNGTKNVAILIKDFKSKAQLRDDIDTVNVGTYWNRVVGYKNAAGLGYDQVTLNTASFDSGAKTCSTTACHNGIETPAWDSGSSGNCMACHTELPK